MLWLGQHTRPIQCVIWDMSDGGGRIAVPHPKNVPQRFTLLLTRDASVRRKLRACVGLGTVCGVSGLFDALVTVAIATAISHR